MEFGPIFRSLLRNRARVVLIVVEVALTLAIVANCLSLILDTRAQLARPSGFDDEHIVAIQSNPFDDRLRDPAVLNRLVDQDVRALRAAPGVRAATHTSLRPWESSGQITAVRVPGSRGEPIRTQRAETDPGLFDTLGISIAEGRGFTEAEYDHGADAPLDEVLPVVVSRVLADQFYPGGGAVGKPLADADEAQHFQIVGIIDRFYNPLGGNGDKVMLVPGLVGSLRQRLVLSRPHHGEPRKHGLPAREGRCSGWRRGVSSSCAPWSRTATSSTAATGCWSPPSTASWRCWCW